MVTTGSIISGAFRVPRNEPKVFALWALICLAASVAIALVTRPMMAAAMSGGAEAPSGLFLRMLPPQLLLLLLMLVMFTASQRAILRNDPGERFAYLRLGMDELRAFLLGLILIIVSYALLLVLGIAAGLLFVGLGLAGGVAAAGIGFFVVVLLLVGFYAWFQTRFSLTFPLTLLRRKIIIGESWRLTRGRFWSLFGAYFAIFLIVLLLSTLASALAAGSYWLDMIRAGMNPVAIQQASQAQVARQLGPIDFMMVLGWIISALSTTLMITMSGGAVAEAVRELAVDAESIAETFA